MWPIESILKDEMLSAVNKNIDSFKRDLNLQNKNGDEIQQQIDKELDKANRIALKGLQEKIKTYK